MNASISIQSLPANCHSSENCPAIDSLLDYLANHEIHYHYEPPTILILANENLDLETILKECRKIVLESALPKNCKYMKVICRTDRDIVSIDEIS